jgi:glycosyltransferase involved in cell wall biosynthesis
MKSNGHSVTVLIPSGDRLDGMANEAMSASLTVIRVGPLFTKGRPFLRNLRELYSIFRTERPDVVHFHVPWAPTCPEAVIAACLARVPCTVRTEHNPIMQRLPAMQRWKMKLLDRLVNSITFVSEGNLRRHLQNCGRPVSKCEVIPNGIAFCGIEKLSPEGKLDLRRRLCLPEEPIIAVMVGSLIIRKGILDFVRAAARALEREPSLHFAVIGEGEARADAMRLGESLGVSSRLHFLGHLENVAECLPAFDIYVQPSHYEGMALSMLEALAGGLPIVTTRVDGVEDVLGDGWTDQIVGIGDDGAIGEAIALLAGDPVRRAESAANSQRRVLADFGADRMASRYEALYERLVRREESRTYPRLDGSSI